MFRAPASLRLIAATVAASTVLIHTSQASAVSLSVQLACAADYYAYCSKHDPDGPAVRVCMNNNGHKLSKRCVNALIGAGEITKAEVDRRSAGT